MSSQIHLFVFFIAIDSAIGSGNVFENSNEHQPQLLNSFRPCVIRKVFLENSIQASEETLSFFNYYKNDAVLF